MLDVKLLGQFDVRLDGQVVDISSRPAQSLLAYLLLQGGTPTRRERLAGLLWPEASEANARSNLRHAIWRLRRALGAAADNYLKADNITVALEAGGPLTLDVHTLERAGSDARAEALARAVAAYRGELLPGFYAEWIQPERERLQTVFERQMQALLEALTREERWTDVVAYGERWIALGQAPEPAYRAVMVAHANLGDMGSLAAAYQRCETTLRRDLAAEPSEQTRDLYQRLRRSERAAQPAGPAKDAAQPMTAPHSLPSEPPASSLPAPATPFVGRQAELEAVTQRLLQQDCRLLTLTGPGGIGKTRLALQAALQLPSNAPPFADGVFFVPLARVGSVAYLASAVAEGLRFSFYGGEDTAGQLHSYLRERRALVVLDNFEHLLEGADLIASLLGAAPGVKFLVTSQERLSLQGEWLFEVDGLDYPRGNGRNGGRTQFEAVQLFLQCAQRVDASFEQGPDDRPAIERICQIVAGMPLGIELAAAWVRTISCVEIAREIERNLGFLTTTLRDVPERHRSLAAVFDYAWNRLSDVERQVFSRLAVFWGGFQREAAEKVADASLASLSALVDKSLLRRTGAGRYDLHGLLRKFGLQKLREAGELELVGNRHQAYYEALAAEAEPGLRRDDQVAWLARLETEHDNFRAALEWAMHAERNSDRAVEAGQRLAGKLARFWYLRGYWREGREWLAHLLATGPRGDEALGVADGARAARASALMGAGWLADENGTEGALYEESLALCRTVGDRWGEAYSLRGVAVRRWNDGEVEQGRNMLEESGAVFEALGDEWGQGLVAYNLGWVKFEGSDPAGAREHWDTSLGHFRRVGDRWGSAVTLSSLAYQARLADEYPKAAQMTEEALAMFRELGDKAGIATSLLRLAQVALRRGDYPQAIELIHEGEALQREVEEVRGLVSSQSLLGLAAIYQGRYDEAITLLTESRRKGEEFWGVEGSNFLDNYLALAVYYRDEADRAQALWERGLGIQRELKDQAGIAYCLFGLGRLDLDRGRLDEAQAKLEESLSLFKRLGDRRYIAAVLCALGRALHAAGHEEKGFKCVRQSLVMRKEAGDRNGLAECLEAWAGLLAEQPGARAEELAVLLGAAEATREAIGAPVPPVEQKALERAMRAVRDRLGEAEAMERARQLGQVLAAEAPEQVLERAWRALGATAAAG